MIASLFLRFHARVVKSNRIFFEISRSGFGLRNLRYSASEQMKFHVSMNLSVKKENSMKVFSCF